MDSNMVGSTEKNHLIVLVPEGAAGNSDLAKKIYWMAHRNHSDVLYLALVGQRDEGFEVSRRMATMQALTSDAWVEVCSHNIYTDDWPQTLKSFYLPGDTIVCHEEQVLRTGFLRTTSVQSWLSENYRAPILALSGFYHPWQVIYKKLLYGLAFWFGCIGILASFSFLEIKVDQSLQGIAHPILLFLLFALEIGSIWIWNRLPKI